MGLGNSREENPNSKRLTRAARPSPESRNSGNSHNQGRHRDQASGQTIGEPATQGSGVISLEGPNLDGIPR